MKALAAVISTAPSHLNLPRPQVPPEDQRPTENVDQRAAHKNRDVTLAQSRVEASDPGTGHTRARPAVERPSARDVVEERADLRVERSEKQLDRLRESIRDGAERVVDGRPDLPSPTNTAVTYRALPDLRTYQSQVVDRESSDVVRSVPTERQIEFSRRYQDYLGRTLDMLA